MLKRKGTFQLSIQMLIIILMGIITVVIVIAWVGGTIGKGQETTSKSVEKSGDAVLCTIECRKCCSGMSAYPDDWLVEDLRGKPVLATGAECTKYLGTEEGCGTCEC